MVVPQRLRALVSDARSHAHAWFGADLETKASDAFCVHLLAERLPRGSRGRTLVRHLVASVAGRAAVPALLEMATEQRPHSKNVTTAASSRQAELADVRTAVIRQLGAVYDEMERWTGGSAPATEICWLNGSLRTWADHEGLADAAGDPAVLAIDVPRRLRPETVSASDEPALRASVSGRNGHTAVGLHPSLSVTGRGQVVAVIDSEVSMTHHALAGRVVHRRNFTVEPWGRPHSHGTALAGIIASADSAFPGVASEVVIDNYKVLAARGRHNADDFGAALALQQALEDGAGVAICAWGAGPVEARPSRAARAVDQAWVHGMVVVKSAGNRGPRLNTMSTPADAPGILVVGATDILGTRVQAYSSRGPIGGRSGPHCVAPGGTWGTDADLRLTCALVRGGFGHLDVGTSFSAAFVAGAAALHLELDPGQQPDNVRRRMLDDAVPLADDQGPEAQGAGLLQIRL